jgi:hypothetical protein
LLLERYALAWRRGEDLQQRHSVILGLRCPYCGASLVVVTARTQSIATTVQFLKDAGGCLHPAANGQPLNGTDGGPAH